MSQPKHPTLSVDGLKKTYTHSNASITAVNCISFEVDRGEIVGILGPNGAGKTTAIKCILGLIIPTEGSIAVEGIDPIHNGREAYRHVSAVLEGARNVFWRLTVGENLRFFAGCHGIHPHEANERFDRLVSMVGLDEKVDEQVRHLSRGMQQKVSLATALAQDTSLLFLDEPTLGLDVEAALDLQDEIQRLAEEENRTIVLSSHNMDVVQQLCDRVIILQDGEIIANDPVDELLDVLNTQLYRITFKTELESTDRFDRFSVEEINNNGRCSMEVTLSDSDEFYEFVGCCRDIDAPIRSMESLEPDLEEVFLNAIEDPPSDRTASEVSQV